MSNTVIQPLKIVKKIDKKMEKEITVVEVKSLVFYPLQVDRKIADHVKEI